MRNRVFPLYLIAFFLVAWSSVVAQIQIGTVKGTISDPTGALLVGVKLTLDNSIIGYRSTATTGMQGEFTFDNVPFGSYTLRADSAGFRPSVQNVSLNSNIPFIVNLKLAVAGANETVMVASDQSLISPVSASTETRVDESFMLRFPAGATRSSRLQRVVATTPGWRLENDGLLHVRGVDDGVLYIIDGIPVTDRLDVASATSYDTEMIRSLNVITGNIPAEFGGRSAPF